MSHDVWSTGYLLEHRFGGDLHLFDGAELLLIGIKSYREKPFYDRVIATGGRVVVVEPFASNAAWAAAEYPKAIVHQMLIEDFVSKPELRVGLTAAIWSQGPEHVEKATSLRILDDLATTMFVVAEMPHGIHEQGPDGGNPWETHRASFYPSDFPEARWFRAVGPEDLPREESPLVNQHLLVWSR
jgi:hypothetical protein